jgi:hypothetical protein
MNEEYESLRTEILHWQDRRFTLVSISIAVITGVLGLDLIKPEISADTWPYVPCILLAFLSCATALTWYAGRANAKISAYLITFHEGNSPGWETRMGVLKGQVWLDLNKGLAAVYFVLGITAVGIPYYVLKGLIEIYSPLLAGTAVVFVVYWIPLLFKHSRDPFIKMFRDLKEDEDKKKSAPRGASTTGE